MSKHSWRAPPARVYVLYYASSFAWFYIVWCIFGFLFIYDPHGWPADLYKVLHRPFGVRELDVGWNLLLVGGAIPLTIFYLLSARTRIKPPGLCLKCKYPLGVGEGERCPECGSPNPMRGAVSSPDAATNESLPVDSGRHSGRLFPRRVLLPMYGCLALLSIVWLILLTLWTYDCIPIAGPSADQLDELLGPWTNRMVPTPLFLIGAVPPVLWFTLQFILVLVKE